MNWFRLLCVSAVLAVIPNVASARTMGPDEKPKEPEEPKMDVSGFVDLYFSINTSPTKPPLVIGGGGSTTVKVDNILRNFDFRDRSPSLNLAEVVIEKKIGTKSPLGFRLDIDAGPATDWVHFAEPGGGDTWRFFQQAYVSWAPFRKGDDDPYAKGLVIDIGKFVTAHGAEVIETKDNANYSRSLLFAWAIPYYHTGVRMTNRFSAKHALGVHVVQGWNNVADNNGNKTLGVMYNWTPCSKWNFVQNFMTGREPNGAAPFTHNAPSGVRDLFDTVITYAANDKTTFTINADYGRQGGGDAGAPAARWYGVAGYVKRQLNEKSSLTVRGEVFRDHNGFNMPLPAGFTGQTVNEVTGTFEFRSLKNLMHRVEVRHDWSNAPTFAGFTKGRQTTFAFGTVLTF